MIKNANKIARKFFSSKENKNLSHIFIRIAVIATSVSLVVMVLSISILDGFKEAIQEKIVGFGGSVVVSKHDGNYSFETNPIVKNSGIIKRLSMVEGVRLVQSFVVKAGLVKTHTDTYGVVLKGIGDDFNWDFFERHLIRGRKLTVSSGERTGKEVVISEEFANISGLDTADNLYMYFIEDKTRMRKYKIVGVYNTGLQEFDKLYVLADIHDVAKLNNWHYADYEELSGYEILINNFKDINTVSSNINKEVGILFDSNNEKLQVNTIKELYPQIFVWLDLLDINAIVLTVIMAVIAAMNLITTILVLILDRTNAIGLFKALGASNRYIRHIFSSYGIYILFKGLFWGNLVAIGVIVLQYFTHIMPLDPQIYYLDYVPLSFNIVKIILINIILIIGTYGVLMLGSFVINKISPARAIKFN